MTHIMDTSIHLVTGTGALAHSSTLTRKERLRRALRREPVDHLPYQTNFTGAMGRRLAEHFGIPVAQLQDRLGNHLLRLELSHARPTSADGSIEYDWWGAGWDTRTEGYWHAFAPLADTIDLDGYAWPNPGEADLLGKAHEAISMRGAEYFVVPNFGMCLFERAWSLRGFDALLMDMVQNSEWVEACSTASRTSKSGWRKGSSQPVLMAATLGTTTERSDRCSFPPGCGAGWSNPG